MTRRFILSLILASLALPVAGADLVRELTLPEVGASGIDIERIQFNEDTLWSGHPHDYSHKGAVQHLGRIRQLLFDGKQKEAQDLASSSLM